MVVVGMTVNEAAEFLEVSPRFVRKLIAQGRIQAKRHGPMWDIDPESVEAYKAAPKRPVGYPKGRPRKQK